MNFRQAARIGITLLLSAVSPFARSQETRASLGGKVIDPQKAVVPKATVTVLSVETGVTNTTETNTAGEWRVQYLLPGHYRFDVAAPGFKETEQTVELQVGDQKLIDEQLQMGERTEVVEVGAVTPLIDTTAAVSGTVITTQELEELPSQSNSPTMLIGLTPGANVSSGVNGGVHLWSNQGLSGTTVNSAGSGAAALNYTIDGGTDTNQGGQVAFEPPSDAVSEFRVATNAYDAAIGRQSSATVAVSIKSGTSAFHGDLYEYNQNNFLNANRYENKPPVPVPTVHTNEYGATFGGPVRVPFLFDGRKKKTFFFFSFDAIHNVAPANTGFISLPTLLERKGDFSQSFTTQTVNGVTTRYPVLVYDPATVNPKTGARTLFQGDAIPSYRISPIGAAILNLLPAPDNAGDGANSDSNNYNKRESQNDTFTSYLGRLDQSWNNANHSYLNVRLNNFDELSFDAFGPSNPLQGFAQHRYNKGLTLDHTLVLRDNLLLDLRYNLTRYEGLSNSSAAGIDPTTLGFSTSYAALQQRPSLPLFNSIVSGAENGGLGTSQGNSYSNDTDQDITASVSQTHGNHNLKYGAEYLIQQEGTGSLGDSGGQFTFGNNWTTQNPLTSNGIGVGSSIGSVLLGLPTSGFLPNTPTGFWSQRYMAFYAQDDWRATSRLTINYGLRWDYQRPVTERYDRYYNRFDPNLVLAPVSTPAQAAYAALIGGASSNVGVQLLQKLRPDVSSFQVRGGIEFANVNGTSRYAENPRYKYFQPRAGFAYRVHPNTVVRGGVGRFVQASFDTGNQTGFGTNTPYIATTDNFITPGTPLQNPYPTGITAPTGNSLGALTNVGGTGAFTDPNIGRVYVDEASAYLDQQISSYLIEIGATINESHGLPVTDPSNSGNAGFNINNPTTAQWITANTPTFDSTGRPADTLPGNVLVANPFKGLPYITNGLQNNSTVTAYSLLRPNPVVGNVLVNEGKGKTIYYALNTKVEKRFRNGFSLLQAFSWGKKIAENTFIGPQVAGVVINRRLDPGDIRFHYVLTPLYELPFGHGKRYFHSSGKLVNELVSGFEVTGIYNFQSGTPLDLSTNSSFFQGGDPASGTKTRLKQFDTSRFIPFPSRNTTVAQLQAYPTWTGVQSLPGYGFVPTATDATKNGVYQDFATRVTYNQSVFGDIRNPYLTDFTLGVRKSFPVTETVRVQLRLDAFNALNHPRFGNIDTTPGDLYFGAVSGSASPTQVNAPRAIQLAGKLYF